MNLLFVCSQNISRSPTGEAVFSKYEGIKAIGCGTNIDAERPISGDLIAWADVIFVMEKSHQHEVSQKFNALLKDKKLICLDIPDMYPRMDPVLVHILKEKVARYIQRE
jgi:predicted protein tyrosine phosphatase